MVYLAELLVVTTVWLKIVRIIARNVPRTRTKAPRRRRSRPSVAAGKQRCRVLDEPGRRPIETQKSRFQTTCLAVASKQENCRDSMPSSL